MRYSEDRPLRRNQFSWLGPPVVKDPVRTIMHSLPCGFRRLSWHIDAIFCICDWRLLAIPAVAVRYPVTVMLRATGLLGSQTKGTRFRGEHFNC